MSLHVIWDWNCTLLDDLRQVVAATSAASQAIGGRALDVDDYRQAYTRPVHLAYERILGRPVTVEEMQVVSAVFGKTYTELLTEVQLAEDATHAVELVVAEGGTQSLLSMWTHDPLLELVETFGMTHVFSHVRGQAMVTHEPKSDALRRHLDELQATEGSEQWDRTVMIGDSVDDGLAASEVGLGCVLVSTGANLRADLERTGFPVCDSLTQAVRRAVVLVS